MKPDMTAAEHLQQCAACNHGRTPCQEYVKAWPVKPNSVCKHCQREIHKCQVTIPHSSRQCNGYTHIDGGSHFCANSAYCNVAEPAEPSASPKPDPKCDQNGPCKRCGSDACQDHSHSIPITPKEEICQNESPRNVNAQVADASSGQMKSACALVASRIVPSEGTPKMEEIADGLIAFFNSSTIEDADIRAEIAAILRPFITPACSPPNGKMEISTKEYGNLLAIWQTAVMLFSGPPNELPDVETMRQRMHKLATPASTGEANGLEIREAKMLLRLAVGSLKKGSEIQVAQANRISSWLGRNSDGNEILRAPTSVPQAEPPK